MKKDTHINLSEVVKDYYTQILRWFQKSLYVCEENFVPEFIGDDDDKETVINFEQTYDAMYEFFTDLELNHQNIVNIAYPGVLKTFKEWSKETNNTSEEDHVWEIFKYIKFLYDFCVKYFMCVCLTKDQRKCLDAFEEMKALRG